ncbi:hypothetical protein [Tsukamurella soli]|uniref:hypothetical protein n=1 Tax=Tsukamurella soli TaxID=644556 RepID=UPI00360C4D5E
MITAIIAASVVIIVLCAAVGLYLLLSGGSKSPSGGTQAAGPSVQTVTAAPTVTATAAPTRTPGTAPSDAAQVCDASVTSAGSYQHSAVNGVTTCPFAENVRAAYNIAGAPGTVNAYSPAKRRLYSMACNYSDASTTLIVCTGGDDAVVWLY